MVFFYVKIGKFIIGKGKSPKSISLRLLAVCKAYALRLLFFITHFISNLFNVSKTCQKRHTDKAVNIKRDNNPIGP